MENITGKFTAGYAKADITPEYPVPLGGFGNCWNRMHTVVLDHIYTQCAALTDARGETLLLFTLDDVKVPQGFFESMEQYFGEKYGIAGKFIHIMASHCESAPDISYFDPEKTPKMAEYRQWVIDRMKQAGEEALATRVPARLSYGSAHAHNLNFVKHAFFDTGVSLGDNKGNRRDGNILRHTTKVDDLLLAIRIDREGADTVTLANWRAHNQFTSGFHKTELTADYVGAFRDAAKEKLNTELMFFMGSAGNVNPYSHIKAEERTQDYKEYGKMLTQVLYDIFQDLTPVEAGCIKADKQMFVGRVNHDDDYRAALGKEVRDYFNHTTDTKDAFAYARSKGFHSPFHAGACWRKSQEGATVTFPISVWSIGELGFSATEFETFDNNGKWVRENSPYKFQFQMGYTDYPSSYLPSAYAYEYECYEVDQSLFQCGTGERAATRQVQMLIHMKYHYNEQEIGNK